MEYKARTYVESLDGISSADLSATVKDCLSKSKGSHQPVFIFDDKNKYSGTFWPYWSIFRKKQDLNDKVGDLMGPVPYLTSDNSIFEVVTQMLSLRLYTLPVFDESRNLIGVISAKGIIKTIVKDKDVKDEFYENIKVRKAYSIKPDEKIREILDRMRNGDISRFVVTDGRSRISGIITRRDIYMALIWPSDRQKMRTKKGKQKQNLFDLDWPEKIDFRVNQVMTTNVEKISESEGTDKAVKKMLNSQSGGLLITDNLDKTRGIISINACLKSVMSLKKEKIIPVVIADRKQSLDFFHLQEIETMLAKYGDKVSRREPLDRIRVVVDTVKNSAGQPKIYELTLKNIFKAGKDLIVKTKSHELRRGINMLTEKSENLMDIN